MGKAFIAAPLMLVAGGNAVAGDNTVSGPANIPGHPVSPRKAFGSCQVQMFADQMWGTGYCFFSVQWRDSTPVCFKCPPWSLPALDIPLLRTKPPPFPGSDARVWFLSLAPALPWISPSCRSYWARGESG
jgi:hypothetical protein